MTISLKNLSKEDLKIYSNSRLFEIYKNLDQESLKCISYFQAYEEMFSKFVGKEIVFVEIGVLHGGSLFMWKEYFGSKAKIIGIDLNPKAKQLEKYGFDIFIGNQADLNFWKKFYEKVGKIDILLDDGGHDNDQQIITLTESIPFINNGGIIVTEDTHASYLKKHGNPSMHSFINYSKHLVDVVNSRFPGTKIKTKNKFRKKLFSVIFYESIVAFKIDSEKCVENISIHNEKKNLEDMQDVYKTNYFPRISKFINEKFPNLHEIPIIKKIIKKIFFNHNIWIKIRNNLRLKKYFD